MTERSRFPALLLLILAAALVIRLVHLGHESIWIDEAHTITLANGPISELIGVLIEDNHPPTHFLIVKGLVAVFGDSEEVVRFPSVILGVFSIFMIYKVGSLLFGRNVGLLSALLLTLSTFHIHYSQEARSYSLMTFLTLLSYYWYIRILERNHLADSIGYAIASALLLYTHNFGAFILISQNVYFAIQLFAGNETHRKRLVRWIVLQVSVLLLFSPWLGIGVNQARELVDRRVSRPRPGARKLVGPFITYAGSLIQFFLYSLLLLIVARVLGREAAAGGRSGLLRSLRNPHGLTDDTHLTKAMFLLVWLLGPFLMSFVVSVYVTPFSARCPGR